MSSLLKILLLITSSGVCLAQSCDNIVVDGSAALKGKGTPKYRTHVDAGLTEECIQRKVSVEKNSMVCYEWRIRTSGQLQLRTETSEDTQNLITVTDSVTFRSPGFYRKGHRHYSNRKFCYYNISIENCNHISVVSSSDHSLFDDNRDYLALYLDKTPTSLFGDRVGSFTGEAPVGSMYAVFWSDAMRGTSRGSFELTAFCNSWNVSEDEDGSGTIDH